MQFMSISQIDKRTIHFARISTINKQASMLTTGQNDRIKKPNDKIQRKWELPIKSYTHTQNTNAIDI